MPTYLQVWAVIRIILIALIGFPLALAAAVIVFSLWLPLFPIWAIMWPCRDADRSFIDFLKTNANVMMFVTTSSLYIFL
jgi:hypothetical protein